MADIAGLVKAHKGIVPKASPLRQQRPTYRDNETTETVSDDVLMSVSPLPRLSSIQVELLNAIAQGLKIPTTVTFETDQRDTWMLGAWTLDTGISISVWTMMPTVSTVTVNVTPRQMTQLTPIVRQLEELSIPGSKCLHKIHKGQHQFMGRLVPELCHEADLRGIVTLTMRNLCFANVGGSKLCMWLKIKQKYYLCHASRASTQTLMSYLPAGFGYVNEHGRMNGICIRRISDRPDLTQLLVGTSGVLQYNGTTAGITPIFGALRDSLFRMMEMGGAGAFISTLQVIEVQDAPQ